MIALYSVGFLTLIFSLILWFRFRDNLVGGIFGGLAILGLIGIVSGTLTADAPFDYKLETLMRDLLFIAISGAIFSYLAKLKRIFWLALAISAGGIFFFYKRYVTSNFPYDQNVASVELAEDGELLLELAEGTDPEILKGVLGHYDLKMEVAFTPQRGKDTDLDDYYVINIPERYLDRRQEIIRSMEVIATVDHIELNEKIKVEPLQQRPATKPIGKNFGLNDPDVDQLWAFEAMKMGELYSALQLPALAPAEKSLLVILDTGVDADHEDLKDNYRSLKSKWDDDPRGHGTHCAGIAAAVSNNKKGVASYSPDNNYVELSSIKVLNRMGMGNQRTIIKGIIEATDRGADVISLSLGGRSRDAQQRAYTQAVKYANQAGAIVVTAAGNSNMDAKDYSPANATGIICVAAIDQELKRAEFSNRVNNVSMGIAAPGVGIYSTIPDDKYATYNGTSMATPYVAGLIAVMKAIRPELSTEETYRILRGTGIETQNPRFTGAFIQPGAAVQQLKPAQ